MADLEFVHEQYESDSYYTIAFKTREEVDTHWGFRWRHVLCRLLRYTDQPRVLDVGAGNGFFVHLARSEFGLEADGLEISDAESAYAREMFGVEFLRCDLARVEGQYDALTSFNVIEHVANPAALLAGMRARLNDGGYLIVTTPNPSCIHRRVLGLQKWNMVAPPHHINLFTRAALEELLRLAGFHVLEYSTISTYINFVRAFDTNGLLLRRADFNLLKSANLGADHFLICRKAQTL
jgi:2-polyprenyl-3-methyl-5-hydroxy-6-metoxy-1,4-benzoquinol methylase